MRRNMWAIQNLFLSLVMIAATVAAQNPPLVNLVVNAANDIPPGFPNSGIAQGSIFKIWGVGIGPTGAVVTARQPLPPSLAGTSITVTVSGVTLVAPIVFVGYGLVAAVLPSNTPIGDGTITLTTNGGSGSLPITVVPATFGITHADDYDPGDGWDIRSVAVVTFPDFQYVGDTHAAKPGDTLTLWGTGLGATPGNGGDTTSGPAMDVGSAPLVFVGGIQSPSVTYWGRSPGSVGLDQINFVVPPNAPLGCNVPIMVQTDNPRTVSNSPTIALADADGATCVDPTQNLPPAFFNKSGLKLMVLSLVQASTLTLDGGGVITSAPKSEASLSLFQVDQAMTPANTSGLNGVPSLGTCSTAPYYGNSIPNMTASYFDQQGPFTLTAPSGTVFALSERVPGIGVYDSGASSMTIPSGTWRLSNVAGGSGIGPEDAPILVPAQVTWTNAAEVLTAPIDRSNPLTITWSGGDSNGYVRISGFAWSNGFVCTAPAAPGRFTIPSSILMGLHTDPAGQIS